MTFVRALGDDKRAGPRYLETVRFGWAPLLLALTVGGCSTSMTVRGRVVHPAQVPVRVFPRILVIASDGAESEPLAAAIAAHLEGDGSLVRRGTAAEARALRERGELARGTILLHVDAALRDERRAGWTRSNRLECGPLGCVESTRPVMRYVPAVAGHAALTVFDGRTGRRLQRETVDAEEAGGDPMGMRLQVLGRLTERAIEMLDQRAEDVAIELHPTEAPEVQAALHAIRDGRWTHGRDLLEQYVGSEDFGALPDEERARVLYDLSQAHRFDPSVPVDVRFERASEALHAAVQLHPQDRYASALTELAAHRRARELVQAQEQARHHNFRVGRTDRDPVPEPPASYR